MVVVLSPKAAESYWVNKEVSHWLQQWGRDQVLLVLADGQLRWNAKEARFDPALSDAAPPVFTESGSLPSEPLYIDVSPDAPWDPRAAAFRDKVTALAAPIHGKPKSQLASDDLREQRRFRRLRAAAIAGLACADRHRGRRGGICRRAAAEAIHSGKRPSSSRKLSASEISRRLEIDVAGTGHPRRCPGRGRCAGAPADPCRAPTRTYRRHRQPADGADRATDTLKIIPTPDNVTSVAFSPDGRRSSPAATTTRCGCGTPAPASPSAPRSPATPTG